MVLGVAGSHPIWKIGWEINQQLGIELKMKELEHFSVPDAFVSPVETLFDSEGPPAPLPFYQDMENDTGFQYFFFPNPKDWMPKETHIFPYILVISYAGELHTPDSVSLQQKLKKADSIISVSDILSYFPENQRKKITQWISFYV
jgi:hypothetical protein